MGAKQPAQPAILVVDDDADVRTLVSQALGGLGYRVEQASTGTEALAAMHRNGCAMVVLDVRLPDISGYEVCRELRDEFGEQLPIMFLSGERTESFDRVGGLLLGADDYLTKPFASDELAARVRRLLARSNHDDEVRKFDLTKRELEVLSLLAAGRSQVTIAKDLVLTEKTVATHLQHILRKLGVHSRAEAVAAAHKHNLTTA
jgi:DNA-binding response OmpR family regulator